MFVVQWGNTPALIKADLAKFTRILQGHVPEGGDATATVLASGTIIIRARDFAKQLTTFRAGGPSVGAKVGAIAKFGFIFAQQLAEAYLRKGRKRVHA